MNNVIDKISKRLPSARKSIKSVEPIMLEVREKINISDNSFYNMLIAITEAVNNAIVHGNKCDPDKTVNIDVILKNDEIIITIGDEGNGFDPDSLADPRDPENLMKEHGRGVFLIRQLSASTVFDSGENGTSVIMSFKIDQ